MATETDIEDPIEAVVQDGGEVARIAAFNPLTETLARLGFAARGLIYLTMGLAAIQVAVGARGAPADQQGAIAAIGLQPAGRVILALIIIGLVGYSLWGVIRAVFDPLHRGKDLKGLASRAGYLFSAASYAALVPPAYAFIVGGARAARNGAQTVKSQKLAASLLVQPWGRWVVGGIGLAGIAVGLWQVYLALRGKFKQQYHPKDLDARQALWLNRIARFGSGSRGVVFAMVGLFLFLAAYNFNAHQAIGIDGALMVLARQPYGPWLLGVVAVGLIAFGIYSALGALWFRLPKQTQ